MFGAAAGKFEKVTGLGTSYARELIKYFEYIPPAELDSDWLKPDRGRYGKHLVDIFDRTQEIHPISGVVEGGVTGVAAAATGSVGSAGTGSVGSVGSAGSAGAAATGGAGGSAPPVFVLSTPRSGSKIPRVVNTTGGVVASGGSGNVRASIYDNQVWKSVNVNKLRGGIMREISTRADALLILKEVLCEAFFACMFSVDPRFKERTCGISSFWNDVDNPKKTLPSRTAGNGRLTTVETLDMKIVAYNAALPAYNAATPKPEPPRILKYWIAIPKLTHINNVVLNHDYATLKPLIHTVAVLLRELSEEYDFSHNDLHAYNIMFDGVDINKPVIIDFGRSNATIDGQEYGCFTTHNSFPKSTHDILTFILSLFQLDTLDATTTGRIKDLLTYNGVDLFTCITGYANLQNMMYCHASYNYYYEHLLCASELYTRGNDGPTKAEKNALLDDIIRKTAGTVVRSGAAAVTAASATRLPPINPGFFSPRRSRKHRKNRRNSRKRTRS